jgi:hypothetical protein
MMKNVMEYINNSKEYIKQLTDVKTEMEKNYNMFSFYTKNEKEVVLNNYEQLLENLEGVEDKIKDEIDNINDTINKLEDIASNINAVLLHKSEYKLIKQNIKYMKKNIRESDDNDDIINELGVHNLKQNFESKSEVGRPEVVVEKETVTKITDKEDSNKDNLAATSSSFKNLSLGNAKKLFGSLKSR